MRARGHQGCKHPAGRVRYSGRRGDVDHARGQGIAPTTHYLSLERVGVEKKKRTKAAKA